MVAVVQAVNKDTVEGQFSEYEEKMLAMLAGHVTVFMQVVLKGEL